MKADALPDQGAAEGGAGPIEMLNGIEIVEVLAYEGNPAAHNEEDAHGAAGMVFVLMLEQNENPDGYAHNGDGGMGKAGGEARDAEGGDGIL